METVCKIPYRLRMMSMFRALLILTLAAAVLWFCPPLIHKRLNMAGVILLWFIISIIAIGAFAIISALLMKLRRPQFIELNEDGIRLPNKTHVPFEEIISIREIYAAPPMKLRKWLLGDSQVVACEFKTANQEYSFINLMLPDHATYSGIKELLSSKIRK